MKNYAQEWFNRGFIESDPIIKFMFYWIAFNWLYNECRADNNTYQTDAIEDYCRKEYEKLSSFNAFDTPVIKIFLEQPVRDILNDEVTNEGKHRFRTLRDENAGKHRLISLILTIYHVRCNLFHGSKSLHIDRDLQLVEASSKIMEGYLSTVLTKPAP